MKNLLGVGGIALALVCTALTGRTEAALIVTEGVSNTGTSNVLANASCGSITTSGTFLTGCLNTSPNTRIRFDGDGTELLEYSGGQAFLEATDGAFDFLKVSVAFPAATTFSKLLINIDASADGSVTFMNNLGDISGPFDLDKNGENKFIITGGNFGFVSFQTTVDVDKVELVDDLKQVRIGGFGGPVVNPNCPVEPCNEGDVPEPTTLTVLGLGLLGAGFARGLRKKK